MVKPISDLAGRFTSWDAVVSTDLEREEEWQNSGALVVQAHTVCSLPKNLKQCVLLSV